MVTEMIRIQIFVSNILKPTGWKEFTGDHLAYLVEEFKSIQRIDLSSVNVSISTRYKTSAQNNIGSCFFMFLAGTKSESIGCGSAIIV